MRKFPSQRWNPHHSSDRARSLTIRPQGNSRNFFLFFFFFCFVGPHWRHMQVPRLGIESELQRPTYARATDTPDPSRICNPHHSSRQHQIFNPLSAARDQTRNLMVPSRIVPRRELLNSFCTAEIGTIL